MPLFKLGDKLLKVGDKLANGAECCCLCGCTDCEEDCRPTYLGNDLTVGSGTIGEFPGPSWGLSGGYYFYSVWIEDPAEPGFYYNTQVRIGETILSDETGCYFDVRLSAAYQADHPTGSEAARLYVYKVYVTLDENCCAVDGDWVLGDPVSTTIEPSAPPESYLPSFASFEYPCNPFP